MLVETMRWLIGVELLGAAAVPLAARVFPHWPDHGYAFAKFLGLLLVGHAVWLTSILGITGFTGPTVIVATVGLAGLGWRAQAQQPRLRDSKIWRLRWAEEAVFLLVFGAGVAIRAMSPAIAGQEKQMDLTFLQSLIRADALPAPDAWLAGWSLPYYYFGYLLMALPAKVMGVDPAVAYNLAVATIPALAATAAFGLVLNLVAAGGAVWRGAAVWGGLAAFGLTVMGNLQALAEVALNRGLGDQAFWSGLGIKNLSAAPSGGWFPTDGSWWFRAARVIPNIEPDGITEFPFFSFLLADLHPHFMAMPLALLILGLAAHQLWTGPGTDPSEADRLTRGVRLWVPAAALGAVIPTNTWDVPLLWGAYAAGVVGAALSQPGLRVSAALPGAAVQLGRVILVALAVFAPYFIGYSSQPLGLGFVTERTPLGSLVVLFGVLLALPLLGGIVALWHERVEGAFGRRSVGFAVGLAAPLALVVAGETTLAALVGLLFTWAQLLWWRAARQAPPAEIVTAGLVALGLGAIVVPELVYLRDVFGTRMNTVFKFYYDAWIVLALAAPLIGWEIWTVGRNASPRNAVALRAAALGSLGAAGLLALAGALYPLGATPARSQAFAPEPTLDGMAHLRAFRSDDVAAIEWLGRQPRRVGVVEAVGDDYSDAGRFATFGGSVAPLGWIGHELQWRGPRPELEARRDLVRRIYTEPFDDAMRRTLRQLGMSFIAVGSLERQLYGAEVDNRFLNLEPAYRSGGTTLYRVGSGVAA